MAVTTPNKIADGLAKALPTATAVDGDSIPAAWNLSGATINGDIHFNIGQIGDGTNDFANAFNDVTSSGGLSFETEKTLLQLGEKKRSNDLAQGAPGNRAHSWPPRAHLPPAPRCCTPGQLQTSGNTVTTEGGFRVESEGGTRFRVFDPSGKEMIHVHGDPHVNEGGSDKIGWDFTKDSVFVLPDGTRITADANYDKTAGTSHSVTQGLVISTRDGSETVGVTGVDGTPTVHGVNSKESLDYRDKMRAQDTQERMDRFHVTYGSDADGIDVIRERNGQYGLVADDGKQRFTDDNGVKIFDQGIESPGGGHDSLPDWLRGSSLGGRRGNALWNMSQLWTSMMQRDQQYQAGLQFALMSQASRLLSLMQGWGQLAWSSQYVSAAQIAALGPGFGQRQYFM